MLTLTEGEKFNKSHTHRPFDLGGQMSSSHIHAHAHVHARIQYVHTLTGHGVFHTQDRRTGENWLT